MKKIYLTILPLLLLSACGGNSSSAQESISPSKSSDVTSVEPVSNSEDIKSESTSVDPNILEFGGVEIYRDKLPVIPNKVKITSVYTYNQVVHTTEKVGNDFLFNNSSEPTFFTFYHSLGEGIFEVFTKHGESGWQKDDETVNLDYVSKQTNLGVVLGFSIVNSQFYKDESVKVASGVDYEGISCDKYKGQHLTFSVIYLVNPLTNLVMNQYDEEAKDISEEKVSLDTTISGFSIEVSSFN